MEQNAYIMEAISAAIYLALGVRLYWRSPAVAEFPERTFGIALLIWAIGYAIYDIPFAFTEPGELIAPFYAYSSALMFNLGNVVFTLFVMELFYKRSNRAGWIVVTVSVLSVLGAAGSASVGDWEQVNPLENPGYWPQTIANFTPAAWLAVEGFVYSFRMRRRVALGFVEPSTHHRIFLLAWVGVMWAWLEIVVCVQNIVYFNVGAWSLPLGIVTGLLELLPMGLLWLVFCPPDAYRRWIEGAAPA